MTIGARLTLWYAVVMFVSLLLMGVLTYHAFAPEPIGKSAEATVAANESDESDMREMLRILFWCGVPPALIALGGGLWLTRRALSPVTRLTAAIKNVHTRNLGEKIPSPGTGDELDGLTEVFNEMTTRLHDSFQHVAEFTLHASHELKTPLTVLHGQIETVLREEKLSPTQGENLSTSLDEIQRLTRIVDSLTLLTKADAGFLSLQRETIALDKLVREFLEDAQTLAKSAGLTVQLTACEPVQVNGDRDRWRQLLLNLTDNAVKYNRPGGSVELSLRRSGQTAELKISNTGPGVAPEILPRLFERFYRGDTAHGRTSDGCGLGLSIVQWIVTAHHGTVKIDSAPDQLTTVTVRLPISGEI